jgi:hypothetical protein
VKAPPGTGGDIPFPGSSRSTRVKGTQGMGAGLLISPRGQPTKEPPPSPSPPTLRGMTNDYLPSLLFNAQMRSGSPTGEERAPGPAAVEWDH